MAVIDIIKNIGTVAGCLVSCVALAGAFIKPFRQFIINKVSKISNKDIYDAEIKRLNDEIAKANNEIQVLNNEIQILKDTLCDVVKSTQEIKEIIFDNEADRLRGELFTYGNRCRRGIPLTLEEFRQIQEVYQKYNKKLHCNSIGTDEYHFIKDYYESLDNQEMLKEK